MQAMSVEQRQELENRLASECAKKEGVTDADLAEMKDRKLPTTQSGKCLHACIIETLGFVSYSFYLWFYHIHIFCQNKSNMYFFFSIYHRFETMFYIWKPSLIWRKWC